MNVFLYVFDSLRSDHVSCYGYERTTTPHVDALAADGYRFENAYSVSTWTKQAAASLFTGLYPSAAGVETVYDGLSPELTTLAEVLAQQDFETVGVTATGHVSPDYGFDAGFDVFEVLSDRGERAKAELSSAFGYDVADEHNFVPPSATTLQRALLERQTASDRNFFGMVWSLDTHDPFFVTEDDALFAEGTFIGSIQDGDIGELTDVYDDMIRVNDRRFGAFIETLKRRGDYEDSLIVVVGDHGEAFGEHGERGHAGPPHTEQIAVPFVVKPPADDDRTYDTERPVQLTDVFPTVLDRLDVTVPEYVQGEVLGVCGGRGDGDPRTIYAETQYNYSRDRSECVQHENKKLIQRTPTSLGPFFRLLYQMLTSAQLQDRLGRMNHSYDIWSTVKSQVAYRLQRPEMRRYFYYLDEQTPPGDAAVSDAVRSRLTTLHDQIRAENVERREEVPGHTFTTIDSETREQLENIGYKM